MTGAIATAGFHAYDEELGMNRTFEPGDKVPDHIAENVGDHAITRKGKRAAEKAAEENEDAADATPESSAPAGDPEITETTEAPTAPVETFDPGAHTVADVLAHLESADEVESERVRAAERAGKNRTTILGD